MEYELSDDKKTLIYVSDKITKIDIPETVEIIGNHAFRNSVIRNIDIPNVKIIEEYAFRNSAIEKIYLPDVIELGGFSFINCVNLHTLVIPKVSKIGYGDFFNCDNLIHLKSNLSNKQLIIAFNNVYKYNAYLSKSREYKLNNL